MAIIGISKKREEISEILSECYSRDLIELEEYEKRIEKVHSCESEKALEVLISDVPDEIIDIVKNENIAQSLQKEILEISGDYGNQKISGNRLSVKNISIEAEGSKIQLDFRNIKSIPKEIFIQLKLNMTTLKITVPPHIAADDSIKSSGSTIRNRRNRKFDSIPIKVIIRISGNAKYSVVKINTK